MIYLNDEHYLNNGTVRACYHHPESANLVVKVPFGDTKDILANTKELKGYHFLMLNHIDLTCVYHCYGFVSTNRGKGLVCDCVRDHDGSVSKTILKTIETNHDCDIDYIMEVIRELCDTLISKSVFLFDLNVKNIVIQVQKNRTCRPIIIDLKGRYDNKELIPVSTYINFFAQKKLERRCKQLLERVLLCKPRKM